MRFDYVRYWKQRHREYGKDMRRVGHRRFRKQANIMMYEKVTEQLQKALAVLDIEPPRLRVLDAGAGIGVFSKFYFDRGAEVWATDVSLDALRQIYQENTGAKLVCCRLSELSCLPEQLFDLVHCFDVLYHITDDRDWEESLRHLGRLTGRFLVLHGQFSVGVLQWKGQHVRVRSMDAHSTVLHQCGLSLRLTCPTHYLFVRSVLTPFVSLVPTLFYRVDNYLARYASLAKLAVTQICVFERTKSCTSP